MTKTEIIKNDEYLSRFAKNDAYVEEHLSLFLRVLSSREKCVGCKGLYQCSQLSVGQRLCLIQDDVLFEEIEYCQYALKDRRSKSVLSSYLYCDIAEKLADLDLGNVIAGDNTFYNNFKESHIKMNTLSIDWEGGAKMKSLWGDEKEINFVDGSREVGGSITCYAFPRFKNWNISEDSSSGGGGSDDGGGGDDNGGGDDGGSR